MPPSVVGLKGSLGHRALASLTVPVWPSRSLVAKTSRAFSERRRSIDAHLFSHVIMHVRPEREHLLFVGLDGPDGRLLTIAAGLGSTPWDGGGLGTSPIASVSTTPPAVANRERFSTAVDSPVDRAPSLLNPTLAGRSAIGFTRIAPRPERCG